MDLSKEYILMCEKAKEIQKYWKPQNADFVKGDFIGYIKNWEITQGKGSASLERFSNDLENFGKYAWYYKDELIWFPRQSQLQAMIGYMGMKAIMKKIYKMYGSFEISNPELADVSMEQLWLYFVMKEKYNKEWNGEDWVILKPKG